MDQLRGTLSRFWQNMLAGRYKEAAFIAGPDFFDCFAWLIICIELDIPQWLRSNDEKIKTWKGFNNGEPFNPKITMWQKMTAKSVNRISQGLYVEILDTGNELG
jgi:hypothetical protein